MSLLTLAFVTIGKKIEALFIYDCNILRYALIALPPHPFLPVHPEQRPEDVYARVPPVQAQRGEVLQAPGNLQGLSKKKEILSILIAEGAVVKQGQAKK